MSYILSVYSISAFKEFLLPAIDNADSAVVVSKSVFALEQEITLWLEVLDGQWYIRNKDLPIAYRLSRDKYQGQPLNDGDLLTITLLEGQILNVIVKVVKDAFLVYKKYDIKGLDTLLIGRSPSCDIRYDIHNLISGEHGLIRKSGDWYVVEDTSTNGIFINSTRLAGAWQLSFGDCIDIFGLRMIFLGDVLAINDGLAGLEIKKGILPLYQEGNDSGQESGGEAGVNKEGGREKKEGGESLRLENFQRSPRKLYKLEKDVVEIEGMCCVKERDRQLLAMTAAPFLAMALPVLFGCSLVFGSARISNGSSVFMYAGLIMAASASAAGTVWSFANVLGSRKRRKEEESHRLDNYGNYLAERAEQVKSKYEKNLAALREMYPSAEECCHYTESSSSLWSRNDSHEDVLYERLGVGDIPSPVKVIISEEKFTLQDDIFAPKRKLIKEKWQIMQQVPVGIDLLSHRLIGVIGGEKKLGAMEIMYVTAAQIAANNCYTDVKMAFFYDEKNYDNSQMWRFAKWFPHVWSEDKKIRYVAKDKAEAGEVFYALGEVLRLRKENPPRGGKRLPKPYYVLFIADLELLEGELISQYLLEPKEEYGVTTLLFAENYEKLPNVCEYLIQKDSGFSGIYCINGDDSQRQEILFDTVAKAFLEEFGRRLSTIRVSETEVGKRIPDTLDFFEMYGICRLEELKIPDRWRKNRTYESMKALVGKKAGGRDCYLDVHEKYHGPHGLVAGTTGAGKSEFLQTYILSLAINFSPEDVSFFIIDFKGGGMADLFKGLPHLVGQISNLSGSQIHRAMISIKSENLRRQRIFSEYGINHINSYTKLYKNKEVPYPLPHLFIIIDEFAELKREEPDFIRELISVAQVGRSLGVHLILATQKPGGIVDDNIRSNSRFKVCLRVQDGQDSREILHKPDAAYITRTGRCYLQVGNDELYEPFQAGYSGAVYDENKDSEGITIAKMFSNTGREELIGKHVRMKQKKAEQSQSGIKEKTQLAVMVAYLRQTAEAAGVSYRLQLWLPVLPTELYLDELDGFEQVAYANDRWPVKKSLGEISGCVGLCDDPANQKQMPLEINFTKKGHLAVCGTYGSGKSTFLQTLVYSLICKYSPEEVNIYGIDYGSRMLAAFSKAPQVGGVIFENELDRLEKFAFLTLEIMKERKELFSGGSYGEYVKAKVTLPAIVIVIDNFAGFRNKTEGKYDDFFIRLSKEGTGYGIFLVLSAAGFRPAEIPSSMGDHLKEVLSLQMGGKFQYAEVMRTMHVEVMPEENVKGRGIARAGDVLLEFQTALSLRAENDFKRLEKIEKLAEEMRNACKGTGAKEIPEIPKNFLWTNFAARKEVLRAAGDENSLPIGFDTQKAVLYSIDLSQIYCYLISGKSGSGKTNMLKVLMASAALKGGRIAVIDFSGELKTVCQYLGGICISDDKALYSYLKEELIPTFRQRNEKKRADIPVRNKEEKIFLFVANWLEFVKHIYSPAEGVGEMGAVIENFLEKGKSHNIFWFGILQADDRSRILGKRAYDLFIRYKQGIHFGGRVSEQRLLDFDHVSYMEQARAEKPGIGMLPYSEDETVRKVAVPFYKE